MLRVLSSLTLLVAACQAALADGTESSRQRTHRYRYYVAPEQHVVEVVQPPWSGNFIINGARFIGRTPACFSWAAGERIGLIAGDWHGRCVDAVFYNFSRRSTCETWCR